MLFIPPPTPKKNRKNGPFFSPKTLFFHDQKFLVVKNRVLGKKASNFFFFFFLGGGGGSLCYKKNTKYLPIWRKQKKKSRFLSNSHFVFFIFYHSTGKTHLFFKNICKKMQNALFFIFVERNRKKTKSKVFCNFFSTTDLRKWKKVAENVQSGKCFFIPPCLKGKNTKKKRFFFSQGFTADLYRNYFFL